MNVTIYHNPACSKSRKTLEIIREHGIEPTIVEYLRTPPSAADVRRLASQLDLPVSGILRDGDAACKAAAGQLESADDRQLAAWLAEHPSALQRPLVVDEDRGHAVVGRPPENVLPLLAGRAE